MKNLVAALFVMLSLHACKKSSDNKPDPAPPTGNYIKINNDTRLLGDVPSTDIDYDVVNNPGNGTLIALAINNKAIDIDDANNDYLVIHIYLAGDTPLSDYKIENVVDYSPSSASVYVGLTGNDSKGMNGISGNLHVTRDANNQITAFKFENVPMKGTYDATVSCSVVFK